MSPRSAPILVLGGTGHYGQHIVRALLARGDSVRVLSRTRTSARDLLGSDIEVVEGDVTVQADVDRALEGSRGVIIAISAMSPALIDRMAEIERDAVIAVFERARVAGVTRMVVISVYDIDLELAQSLGIASARLKWDVERALGSSELNWTVLGAPPSIEIFFAFIRGGTRMIVPGGGPPKMPNIAPQDLGVIAAQAVNREDLSGTRFRLAGPDLPSFAEAAAQIGEVRGQRITFVGIPLLFPMLARMLMWPLSWFSARFRYIRTILNYVRLLRAFPHDHAHADHQRLMDTFEYQPTTLVAEARRRLEG